MATDPLIVTLGIGGMIAALVLRSIVPYLLKRQEAEQNGQPVPPFATAYMTTFIISVITGIMGVMVSVSALEERLSGEISGIIAFATGFTFTFTPLELTNKFVDLKLHNIALQSFKSKFLATKQQEQS